MAGRKKLFKNYAFEHITKSIRDDGISIFSFQKLKEDEKPKYSDIGKFVYHAADVYANNFVVYKIMGYKIQNEKILFEASDYYRFFKNGTFIEKLGATRTFYQDDMIIIPDAIMLRFHKNEF